MASLIAFDHDPPRVSSPWLTPTGNTPNLRASDSGESSVHRSASRQDSSSPSLTLLADCGITKLEAEPQEGPTEYKLHLLLRPRRSFIASSTGVHVSGSHQNQKEAHPSRPPTNTPQPSAAS